MDYDTLIFSMSSIARETQDMELKENLYWLGYEVAKNGITGLVPLEEGGIEDGVPFDTIILELREGMEQASCPLDRSKIEDLYAQLITHGVDGYVKNERGEIVKQPYHLDSIEEIIDYDVYLKDYEEQIRPIYHIDAVSLVERIFDEFSAETVRSIFLDYDQTISGLSITFHFSININDDTGIPTVSYTGFS
mgnify:FL=1